MIAAAFLLRVAPDPTPSPSDVTIDGTPLGSPGFLGFVFTFALALAVVFLFLSLTKQLRVVDRRAKALGLDDESAGSDENDRSDDSVDSVDSVDRVARPHADLGTIDAGPGGPDLEVDADVAVAPRDVLPADEPDRTPRPDGPSADDRPDPAPDGPGASR